MNGSIWVLTGYLMCFTMILSKHKRNLSDHDNFCVARNMSVSLLVKLRTVIQHDTVSTRILLNQGSNSAVLLVPYWFFFSLFTVV